jgi:hypothetical protein
LFARWTEDGKEILLDFGDESERLITGMAPVSDSEIFVSVFDAEANQYSCGGSVLLWFDGTEFHRF